MFYVSLKNKPKNIRKTKEKAKELRMEQLSPKELDVLALVDLGYSDKEIGKKLRIKYGTVRTHIDRIVLKLHARNRGHAVLAYILLYPEWLTRFS